MDGHYPAGNQAENGVYNYLHAVLCLIIVVVYVSVEKRQRLRSISMHNSEEQTINLNLVGGPFDINYNWLNLLSLMSGNRLVYRGNLQPFKKRLPMTWHTKPF